MTDTQVRLTPVVPNRPGLALVLDLAGDDTVTGGAGGWVELARPRRLAGLEWSATPLRRLVLPLVFSHPRERSVEAEVKRLGNWGLPMPATGKPAVIRVTGPVRVEPTSRWVIDTIEWGTQIRNDAGDRTHQEVVLSLMEYVDVVVRKSPAKKSRSRRGKKGKGKDPKKGKK